MVSPGKEFGELRFLEGLLLCLDSRLGQHSIFVVEVLSWLVGVVYVDVVERMWHICCFIVWW